MPRPVRHRCRAIPTVLQASGGQQGSASDAGGSGGLEAQDAWYKARLEGLQARRNRKKELIASLPEDVRSDLREKRREGLEAARARIRQGFEGQADIAIVFDLSFGDSSTDKQCRSLAKQIENVWSYARDPSTTCAPCFYLTSFQGNAAEALRRRGAEGWQTHRHEEHFTEVFRERRADWSTCRPTPRRCWRSCDPGRYT